MLSEANARVNPTPIHLFVICFWDLLVMFQSNSDQLWVSPFFRISATQRFLQQAQPQRSKTQFPLKLEATRFQRR